MGEHRWWSELEPEEAARLRLLIPLGSFLVLVIPSAFSRAGRALDRRLGLPPLGAGGLARPLGWSLAVGGLALGLWTNVVQFTVGRGTPVPLAPPRRLLDQGPYSRTRNPMALGAVGYYLGLAIAHGSLGNLALAAGFGAALAAYIRLVEEKELEKRFGDSYVEYRARVPFFFPSLHA
jgi:protein-S-isoprenylcysteine O-methyltransferase Ste14